MTQRDHYAPKHRQPAARRVPRQALRTVLVLSGIAVVGTGTAVAGGAVTLSPTSSTTTDTVSATAELGSSPLAAALPQLGGSDVEQAAGTPAPSASSAASSPEAGTSADTARVEAARDAAIEAARRTAPVSRSDRRGVADPRKEAALSLDATGNAMTRSEDMSDEDPRTIAQALLGDSSQFGCLDSLWTRESGWSVTADNPSSSAYGIPQALPGSKMSSFGADWATNPVTQIRWGLDYIEDRYGSPCGAWSHSQGYGWY